MLKNKPLLLRPKNNKQFSIRYSYMSIFFITRFDIHITRLHLFSSIHFSISSMISVVAFRGSLLSELSLGFPAMDCMSFEGSGSGAMTRSTYFFWIHSLIYLLTESLIILSCVVMLLLLSLSRCINIIFWFNLSLTISVFCLLSVRY